MYKNNIITSLLLVVLILTSMIEINADILEKIETDPNHPELPIERKMVDDEGNTLIRQTFTYDEVGRVAEETIWKCTDGPYYVHYEFMYAEEGERLRKTSIKSYERSPHTHIPSGPPLLASTTTSFFEELVETFKIYFTWEKYIQKDVEYLSGELFGDFFLHLMGYYELKAEVDCYGEGEIASNVRITFINGILNLKGDFLDSVMLLSRVHGDANIHYVFRPTEGWSWDILKSSLIKFGYVSPQAEALAALWKTLIKEMGGTKSGGIIYHFAHSMGGSNTYAAKHLLTEDEQKMICVYTFGSPTMVPDGGFHSVTNYVSVRDGVGLLDPIGRLAALVQGESHIIYVGDYDGMPIVDHLFDGESYRKVIDAIGLEFVEKYGCITGF